MPWIADDHYLIAPVHLSTGYALSLSTTQLVGILLIALLTLDQHARPRIRQDHPERLHHGEDRRAARPDRGRPAARLESHGGRRQLRQPLDRRAAPSDIVPGLSAVTAFGLFVAVCVSQTGSLFSADAWNNITFTAGEVKDPRRNIPLSLALGTFIVIGLYLLANVAYLVTLPFDQIQHAAGDRVATATLNVIFPGLGATIMAIGIMISTFGCTNGLILAGARAYYAMARDGLFFRSAGELNAAKVPAWGLVLPGRSGRRFWCCRAPTIPATHAYGNLYSNLLDYVISAALIFYILTIAGIFRLRRTRPERRSAVPRVRLPGRAGALHRRRRGDPAGAVRLPAGDDVAGAGDRAARRAGVLRVEAEGLISPRLEGVHFDIRALDAHLDRVALLLFAGRRVAEQVGTRRRAATAARWRVRRYSCQRSHRRPSARPACARPRRTARSDPGH